ncbi:TPA: DUF4352 domain-containing protein [Enterococcus faecium]|nr:DUF4352 domain-containing protein [Enterococcus faecium]
MAKKKVTGEDGKTYVMKEKKPFYKRVWFWILVVIVVFIVGGALGGGDDKKETTSAKTEKVSSNDSAEKDTQNSSDPLKQDFAVGDTVSYEGYEIKVNNVQYSNGSEFDTPDDGKQYVIANITITNNSGKKQSYNPYDFKLNADGNATNMDEITTLDNVNQLNSGDLDDGASVTGDLVGQAATNAKLKLQYATSIWNDETVDISLN